MKAIKNKLVESFKFYKVYHKHPINKGIHLCTIPILVITMLVLFSYIGFIIGSSHIFNNMCAINIGLIAIVIYLTAYFILDVFSASLLTPIIIFWYLSANVIRYYVPFAWLFALIIHFIAWVLQFIGHGIYEENKPALVDSLIQAFLMAPMFVFLELLFSCGYNPDFRKEVEDETLL